MTAAAPAAQPRLGLIPGEPEAVYRASGALGSTEVRAYLQDPEGYRLRYVERHPLCVWEGNDAAELGTSVHALLEGEEAYRAKHAHVPADCITDSGKLSTSKGAKAWVEATTKAGLIPLMPAEDIKVRFLVDRIRANPVALRLMTGGQPEVSARVRDPHTGLLVQARFDRFHPEWTVDYKTTGTPLRAWKWHVRDYRLDVQAALYDAVRNGVGAGRAPFYWIVQSTAFPFSCRVIECPGPVMDLAMGDVDRALTGIVAKDWGKPQSEPDVLEPA